MSLLDGIGADFGKFDILRARKKSAPGAIVVSEQSSQPPSSSDGHHASPRGLSFSPEGTSGAGLDAPLPGPLVPSEEETDRTLATFFNSSSPSSPAAAGPLSLSPCLVENAPATVVGEKRPRDVDVCDPSSKQPKTSSALLASTEAPSLGFPQPSFSAVNAFASLSRSSTVGPSPSFAASFSDAASSSNALPPRLGFSSKDYPASSLHSITPVQWSELRRIVSCQFGFDEQPQPFSFLSQRAGSAPVPSPESDFHHGLGNLFHVPSATLRIRDDSRHAASVREFTDSIIPPLRAAEGSFFSYVELADLYDGQAFSTLCSGALMRRSLLEEIDRLNNMVRDREGTVNDSHKMLSEARGELQREKETSNSFKISNERLNQKNQSLLSKNMQFQSRINQLESQLSDKVSQIQRLSSSQEDMDKLKAELDHERTLNSELESRIRELMGSVQKQIDLRRETLQSFPKLFGLVLDHPDMMGVIGAFNRASVTFGKHLSAAESLDNDSPPESESDIKHFEEVHDRLADAREKLVEADAKFREKAFPILTTIVKDLDAPLDAILALFAPLVEITTAIAGAPSS